MRLQFLIPQYEETDEILKPLLDSIAIQQSIDFNEIGVIICNDGSDVKLSEEFLNSYPFEVKYFQEEHRGVSATRNACLDHADAEYVMFCDADDMFCHACSVYMIFNEIDQNGDFDTLTSAFTEETRNPQDKDQIVYVNRDVDSTFVHGKVHRRRYLLKNKIRWNDSLTIHEDSYFNILCQNLTENAKYCPFPFYLWKWRDESVCRHDPDYILKTYNNMLDSNDALVDEFVRRMREDKAKFYCGFMIMDAYYQLNKPEWIEVIHKDYHDAVEKRFAKYFAKHKSKWESLTNQERMEISNGVRARSVKEGMLMETITLKDWLNKIKSINIEN